ncbi:hypothetical protein [Halorubellus salinus]|uniref:hypothetical protein n=1 Tax=Halorubellus salinus TaxID=755309 RepID=UPI001D07C00E|nr:hypothetical protein [Halorubellus salinus]
MSDEETQGFEALASNRAEPTDQPVLCDGGTPETVDCTTCGATARRITWGATACTCYRCTECHAGGHIAPDDTRQGGVFQELDNLHTRLLNGGSRVMTDGGLVTDADPECPSCDASDWDENGQLTCGDCGYTPRASVREHIRAALGGEEA